MICRRLKICSRRENSESGSESEQVILVTDNEVDVRTNDITNKGVYYPLPDKGKDVKQARNERSADPGTAEI